MGFVAVRGYVRLPRPASIRCIRYCFAMTFIPVPGVASTVLSGMIGTNPWAVTHHWKFGTSAAPWSQSDLDLLCLTVYNAWGTALKPQTGNNVDTRQVTGVDLTNTSGVGSLYTHAPVTGTNASPVEPSSTAVVVQNRIASRYRGGHPRTFWPAWTITQMANEHQWQASQLGTFNAAIVSFISAIIAAPYTGGVGGLEHVIPRYTYTYTNDPTHHKWLKERATLLNVYTVQSYFTVQQIGSQRRRLTP